MRLLWLLGGRYKAEVKTGSDGRDTMRYSNLREDEQEIVEGSSCSQNGKLRQH